MRTVILIPCYNEAITIKKVINDFQRVMPHADIYVYDNNSTDGTDKIAKAEGAIVRYEYRQGKGNVVRSMFRDIDADCYIMVDGDDTYPAEAAPELEKEILEKRADMVIGDRLSSTYFTENKRPFHNSGNIFVRKSINKIFDSDLHDIMTGMRAFDYDFVKSYPVHSKEFEIETEMSIFALNHNFKLVEIPIDYRDRTDGSLSKLNTFSDGFKVIRVILSLFRDTKPLSFFSLMTLILLIIAFAYFYPVLMSFLATGTVLKIPTLISVGVVFLTAVMIFLSGVILHVLKKQHDQNFEQHLTLIRLARDAGNKKDN
ncbi:MAG: glycosyltransferase family 2 protein [Methanobrevibacter sp.]